jgi:hypothetical protein
MIRMQIVKRDHRIRVLDDDKVLGVASREQSGHGSRRSRVWAIVIDGTLILGPNKQVLQNAIEDKFGYERTIFKKVNQYTRAYLDQRPPQVAAPRKQGDAK